MKKRINKISNYKYLNHILFGILIILVVFMINGLVNPATKVSNINKNQELAALNPLAVATQCSQCPVGYSKIICFTSPNCGYCNIPEFLALKEKYCSEIITIPDPRYPTVTSVPAILVNGQLISGYSGCYGLLKNCDCTTPTGEQGSCSYGVCTRPTPQPSTSPSTSPTTIPTTPPTVTPTVTPTPCRTTLDCKPNNGQKCDVSSTVCVNGICTDSPKCDTLNPNSCSQYNSYKSSCDTKSSDGRDRVLVEISDFRCVNGICTGTNTKYWAICGSSNMCISNPSANTVRCA